MARKCYNFRGAFLKNCVFSLAAAARCHDLYTRYARKWLKIFCIIKQDRYENIIPFDNWYDVISCILAVSVSGWIRSLRLGSKNIISLIPLNFTTKFLLSTTGSFFFFFRGRCFAVREREEKKLIN